MPGELSRCSFCNRSERETRKLVAQADVRICAECITLCLELIGDRAPAAPPPPARSRPKEERYDQDGRYIPPLGLDRAIAELQKVVTADPLDLRSRLKLGDLLARRGDLHAAAVEWLFVARGFADEGFPLKATAVAKQVLKFATGDDALEAHALLMELYRLQGLDKDAIKHEQILRGIAPERAERLAQTAMEHRSPRPSEKPSCSSCSKPQAEVVRLIAGPTIYMCDACVRRAAEQL